MIRRDAKTDEGSPAWALISQVEHGRVAGELATDWGNVDVAPYPCAETIRPTVFHHDDGWKEWEQRPTIDPVSGKPLAFTEMPNDIAHDIWRQSIERVRQWGPLAQYMVAQHFMRLRLSGDETDEEGVQTFLSEYGESCDHWRAEFLSAAALQANSDVPELAVDYLQSFDLFSLYLCCTPRPGPYELALPRLGKLAIEIGQQQVMVDPWPWTTSDKLIRATAALIPAEPLQSDEQLQECLNSRQIEMSWQLLPKSKRIEQ